MKSKHSGIRKSGAQRQQEFRARRSQWEQRAASAINQIERLKRALAEVEADGVPIPSECYGSDGVLTVDSLTDYYLIQAQVMRMEKFQMMANPKKAARSRAKDSAAS